MASIFRDGPRQRVRRLPLHWNSYLLRLGVATVGLLALACGAWAIEGELDEHRAISGLRQGGYVVYLRHADRYKGPKENLNQHSTLAAFSDCSHQRNLTPKGRAQARQLGEYLRALEIPIDQVIANAQCRTRDTALLAFGEATLEPRLYDPSFVLNLLATPPARSGNIILVGNDFQFQELTGIELARAEAAVVQPDGRGHFTLVSRLELDDWAEELRPGWW